MNSSERSAIKNEIGAMNLTLLKLEAPTLVKRMIDLGLMKIPKPQPTDSTQCERTANEISNPEL